MTETPNIPVRLRKGLLVIGPAPDDSLASWLTDHAGQVFLLREKNGVASLYSLGPEAQARREPLNITSRSPQPLRLVSNFADTPFELDERAYASIEGFWQGLKFPDEADRRRLAALYGSAAKDAGYYAPKADTLIYRDASVRIGTWDHWQLMKRACAAKFDQHDAARAALLSTGQRPLVHVTKPDSRTIPGVIMAQIWMQIRHRLQKAESK
jgi:predicted NAD-dependent protein-ADP-ribosyltransferase YbiA (DUF1768 family)